jgi:hypothetical protein
MGAAVVVAWNAPYAWYWRIAIFLGIMFIVGVLYPTIQNVWAKRRYEDGSLQMASNYRGVHLIGDKPTGKITDVQVVDRGGSSIPLPLIEYINRGAEPPYRTLPREEDVKMKPAKPKRAAQQR